ncbi:MAG TPA: DUF3189 family protein [Syntrophomonadaceae bacterium]|nr:DUF3189 family protein [Syntrophomonadaceae bacterium]HPR94025.1 DUF3189 family protein [Syntrophomonadaceae bacterium]
MIIIYHCFGGSHSSVTAAAIHLGLLSSDRLPSRDDIMALPYFDKTTDNDFGSIRFIGFDDNNNAVYVLGKKSQSDRFSNVLTGIAELLDKKDDLTAVNTMGRVNWSMKLGGYTSRKIGMAGLGRPVVIQGTIKAFWELVNLVEMTKFKILNRTQN